MGNCSSCGCGGDSVGGDSGKAVETPFFLPSPLPEWPQGGGFGGGTIDLGGVEVRQVSTFSKVWSTSGATFFKPWPIPDGFSLLGFYAQPNDRALDGRVLVARATGAASSTAAALSPPVDYTLVWSSRAGDCSFWLPVAPDGYKAAGVVVTTAAGKPLLDEVACIANEFTDESEPDTTIWTDEESGFSVFSLLPSVRGVEARGIPAGTFLAKAKGSTGTTTVACLKNTNASFTKSMPNLAQIGAVLDAYTPVIYLHPDELYLPSSVQWFFDKGAVLRQKGNTTATRVASDGSNLPQGGSNDGEFWLDLPADAGKAAAVKKGDLTSARVYVHVKPMLGGTATDFAIWLFYPFNGPARLKLVLLTISLGKIGEHVGDWEHLTLRVSNFNGELRRVYFSQHSAGVWVEASDLEFAGDASNKPVAYSSLSGHAHYSKPGLVLQGDAKLGIGIRNDAAKGRKLDTGGSGVSEVVAAEYLAGKVKEPAWLEYEREWGPKVSYDSAEELRKALRILPRSVRKKVEKVLASMPSEMFGEEGPTGPKWRSTWSMDEEV